MMGYKIYELVGKDKLTENGYYTKTVTTYKLREIDDNPLFGFDNINDAMEYIKSNGGLFKNSELTILPIINVDYEGKVIS